MIIPMIIVVVTVIIVVTIVIIRLIISGALMTACGRGQQWELVLQGLIVCYSQFFTQGVSVA